MRKAEDHLGNTYPSLKKMCEAYNIPYSNFHIRYYTYGWSLEDSLTKPIREKAKKGLTKKTKDKSQVSFGEKNSFSQFPSEAYIYFIRHKLKVLNKEAKKTGNAVLKNIIESDINRLERKLMQVTGDGFFYRVMDYIYLGQEDFAKELCDPKTFFGCVLQLRNPSELIIEVYPDLQEKQKELDELWEKVRDFPKGDSPFFK